LSFVSLGTPNIMIAEFCFAKVTKKMVFRVLED
jgi:hypothetical protein